MSEIQNPTSRTRVGRLPERGSYDRATAYKILDEGFICHVGFDLEGQPFVIPTSFGRKDDSLYIHGSAASRMLRQAGEGIPVCVTVTILDGLVLARSIFHHSMNYRSLVVLGNAVVVEGVEQKLEALRVISEHIIPGRWDDVRQPTAQELKATTVLRLPITEFSAKVRTGPPKDDEGDYDFPTWAGIIPLEIAAGSPLADGRLMAGQEIPEYAENYSRTKRD
jgi:nitroimidazol reductase NimA-like FMN-containing flavoprotein (pyridoxamine 5'-phosphate oxidase superfamily)